MSFNPVSRTASIYQFTCEFLLGGAVVSSHCRASKVIFYKCGCCVMLLRVKGSRATLIPACHVNSLPMLDSASNSGVYLLRLFLFFFFFYPSSLDKTAFYRLVELLRSFNLAYGAISISHTAFPRRCLRSSRFYFSLLPTISARLVRFLFLK